MAQQQHRNRDGSRYGFEDEYADRSGQRYPGGTSGEFSQFGGPHPEGYREFASGGTGWNNDGGRSTGYGASQRGSNQRDDQDRGYGQSRDYREYNDRQRGSYDRSMDDQNYGS